MTHRPYGGSLGTQLGGQLEKDFLYVSYVFPYAFTLYLRPVSRTHSQFKALFKGTSLYTRLYFLLYFHGSVEVFTEAIRMWFHF
jgi:ABC-type arginine/histidine transport system permease subunit